MQRHDCEPLRNNYDRAYRVTHDWLKEIQAKSPPDARHVLLLSPGLPAAQVGMIIAAQTVFRPDGVELVNTSKERGCERVHLPFHLSVDVLSSALGRWQGRLAGETIHAAFDEVLGSGSAQSTRGGPPNVRMRLNVN